MFFFGVNALSEFDVSYDFRQLFLSIEKFSVHLYVANECEYQKHGAAVCQPLVPALHRACAASIEKDGIESRLRKGEGTTKRLTRAAFLRHGIGRNADGYIPPFATQ
jgi:hypothetical protein